MGSSSHLSACLPLHEASSECEGIKINRSLFGQVVRHRTRNAGIVGSIPTGGILFFLFLDLWLFVSNENKLNIKMLSLITHIRRVLRRYVCCPPMRPFGSVSKSKISFNFNYNCFIVLRIRLKNCRYTLKLR